MLYVLCVELQYKLDREKKKERKKQKDRAFIGYS